MISTKPFSAIVLSLLILTGSMSLGGFSNVEAQTSNLFVSADSFVFNNKISGPQVVQVVIRDQNISNTSEEKKVEPKVEKKTESAEKAKEVPKKDTKPETMEAAKAVATLKVPKTVTGVLTSVQDPAQGHENHQLAIVLPPSDKVYRGYLTYAASENVQLVALHGPLKDSNVKGQKVWSTDGKTKFGLTFVDKENSAGVWQFSGNAIAIHTKNTEPFTVSYSVTYTEHIPDGEKVFRKTMTSQQDPGVGHETHQLALLLPPRGTAYSGHLTWDASEPIQIVTLIGPLTKGEVIGLPSWTADGETYYALSLVPTKAAGSTQFSGNALALHTMNSEPFTVSYSLVLTK